MQEITQCLSGNWGCFKDKSKLRQHLASLWRKKPRAEGASMTAQGDDALRTPEQQGQLILGLSLLLWKLLKEDFA